MVFIHLRQCGQQHKLKVVIVTAVRFCRFSL